MSLILFTAPTPDGYKISIALEEMGLAYDVRTLDLAGGAQKQPDFLRLNPNGKVPCLVDDGFAIMESGAILLWLAEKAGQLLPSDPHSRSETLQWLMLQVGGLGFDACGLTCCARPVVVFEQPQPSIGWCSQPTPIPPRLWVRRLR